MLDFQPEFTGQHWLPCPIQSGFTDVMSSVLEYDFMYEGNHHFRNCARRWPTWSFVVSNRFAILLKPFKPFERFCSARNLINEGIRWVLAALLPNLKHRYSGNCKKAKQTCAAWHIDTQTMYYDTPQGEVGYIQSLETFGQRLVYHTINFTLLDLVNFVKII